MHLNFWYCRRSNNVAVFVRTDVTSWDDNKELFATAEKEFGGVDVSRCQIQQVSGYSDELNVTNIYIIR